MEDVPWEPELIYRWEVTNQQGYLEISESERDTIVAQARNGSAQARETILCALLKMVVIYATRMRRDRACLDFFELVSRGNYTLVERLESALQQNNPWAYLLSCAKLQMIELFRVNAENCITTPRLAEPYIVIPLNPGLDEIDFDIPEPYTVEENYTALYDALEALPTYTNRGEAQRELIYRLFGLNGFSCENMTQIAGVEVARMSGVYGGIKNRRRRALVKLQRYLEECNPEFVQRHKREAR